MEVLADELRERASALGFARSGFARVGSLEPEASQLRRWVEAGQHGQMGYMAETLAQRLDPQHPRVLPSARTVMVLATPYAGAESGSGPEAGSVARYAWGRDYHNVLSKRARKLARLLRERGYEARVAVDAMPVFERAWAQRAGVGFIGKNCCLIVPGLGSHVFLACVLTSAELPASTPLAERCGSCRRCLDACPTAAFRGPRQLDARKCISYLNIELREQVAPASLRSGIGEWLFGCDACQDVCPFNHGQARRVETEAAFQLHPRWAGLKAEAFLDMSDEAFAVFAQGSPLKRSGVDGMARNAAVVLGNRGDRRHLPVLKQTAKEHAAGFVREAASWAVTRIEALSPGPDE